MVLPPRGHFFFYNFEEKEYRLLGRAPGLFVKGEGIPAFVAGAGLIFERERRALFGRAAAGFISSVCVRAFFFSVRAHFERVSALSPRFRVFSGAAPAPRAPRLYFSLIRRTFLRTSPARAQPPCTAAKMAAAMAAKPMR